MPRRRVKPPAEPRPWPTSFRLPPDLRADLEQHAADQDRPLTYVITSILQQWQAYWRAKKQMKLKPEPAPPAEKEAPQ